MCAFFSIFWNILFKYFLKKLLHSVGLFLGALFLCSFLTASNNQFQFCRHSSGHLPCSWFCCTWHISSSLLMIVSITARIEEAARWVRFNFGWCNNIKFKGLWKGAELWKFYEYNPWFTTISSCLKTLGKSKLVGSSLKYWGLIPFHLICNNVWLQDLLKFKFLPF